MAYRSAYTGESDMEDDFDRSNQHNRQTNNAEFTMSDTTVMTPPELTPTFAKRSLSRDSQASISASISSWTSSQCADFVKSLGLGQYADSMIDEDINGEALVEMNHADLKDVGIGSVGHRLSILKGVYDIKIKQHLTIESDHYVPLSAEAANNEMQATQEDITRVIDSIRLRDSRIIAAEAELRAMKEDVNRLMEENQRLRDDSNPQIRIAKDRSVAMKETLTTPPPDKLNGGLFPSQPSPSGLSQISPTSPAYSMSQSSIRHFPRNATESMGATLLGPTLNPPSTVTTPLPIPNPLESISSRRDRDRDRERDPYRERPTPLPLSSLPSISSSTPLPPAISTPLPVPSTSSSSSDSQSNEILKSFRVSIEDPCHKVLPAALQKYKLNDDWRLYALYIVYGDQERCLGLEEKPLLLFKQLDKEGRKPMFMLRKHAAPAKEGWSGPKAAAGAGNVPGLSGGLNGVGPGAMRVPGGVL